MPTVFDLIFLVFKLMIIGSQAWFFWWLYDLADAQLYQLVLTEIFAVFDLIFFIFSFITGISIPTNLFLLIFLPTAVWLILEEIRKTKEKIKQRIEENKKIENLFAIIEKTSEAGLIYPSYMALADIYFKKEMYDKSLQFYNQADKIQKEYKVPNAIDINQKIKITEKEYKIKSGEIWICKECSCENSKDNDRCISCGYNKNSFLSIIQDFWNSKKEIKKWVFTGILVFLGIILGLVLIVILATLIPAPFFKWLMLLVFLIILIGVIYIINKLL